MTTIFTASERGDSVKGVLRSTSTRAVALMAFSAVLVIGAGTAAARSSRSGAPAPVKLLVMYQFKGSPIAEHPEVGAGAKAAALAINAKGGINGHPVQIITCDNHDSPTQELACAQKAISSHVTAVVGSLFETGAQAIPALQQARIPIIGGLGVYTPDEFTNPDSFPLMGGAVTTYPAIPYLLARQGMKKLAVVVFSGAGEGLASLIKSQTERAGMKYVGTVNVPLTASDYSPYAQALKSLDPDVTVQVLSTTGSAQIMQIGKTLGLRSAWANQTLNIDVSNLKTFGSLANGMYITSSFPPATAGKQFKGIAAFNAEMDAASKAHVSDTGSRTAQAITSWLAVHAVATVAKGTKGMLTSGALLAAMKTKKVVSVEGLIGWQPNASGPSVFPRIFNSNVYLERVVNGKLTLVSTKPANYFKLAGLTH